VPHQFNVTFQHPDGNPENVWVNTWHFSHIGPPSDFDNVRDMLEDFYTEVPTGTTLSIESFFPDSMFSPTASVTAYNLADPEPRVPVYTSTFAVGPSSADSLPTEVSLCLSLHAEFVSGSPNARRRNRKYLGPFVIGSNSDGRPGNDLVECVLMSARDLLAASEASASWDWVTWSPTASQEHEVVGGWVDNAWDTQRRRGLDPTLRGLWTSSTPT
jgi:hypothetical protein